MKLKAKLKFKWEYRKTRKYIYKKLKNHIKNQHIFSKTILLIDDYYIDIQRTTCNDTIRIHNKQHETLIKIVDYGYALQNMLKPEYFIMDLSLKEVKELFKG